MTKPRKELSCDFGQIHPNGIRRVEVFVRNGEREIQVGDIIGGRQVIAIEMRGRKLDVLGQKMTAKITFDGMPLLTIAEPYRKWDEDEKS